MAIETVCLESTGSDERLILFINKELTDYTAGADQFVSQMPIMIQ